MRRAQTGAAEWPRSSSLRASSLRATAWRVGTGATGRGRAAGRRTELPSAALPKYAPALMPPLGLRSSGCFAPPLRRSHCQGRARAHASHTRSLSLACRLRRTAGISAVARSHATRLRAIGAPGESKNKDKSKGKNTSGTASRSALAAALKKRRRPFLKDALRRLARGSRIEQSARADLPPPLRDCAGVRPCARGAPASARRGAGAAAGPRKERAGRHPLPRARAVWPPSLLRAENARKARPTRRQRTRRGRARRPTAARRPPQNAPAKTCGRSGGFGRPLRARLRRMCRWQFLARAFFPFGGCGRRFSGWPSGVWCGAFFFFTFGCCCSGCAALCGGCGYGRLAGVCPFAAGPRCGWPRPLSVAAPRCAVGRCCRAASAPVVLVRGVVWSHRLCSKSLLLCCVLINPRRLWAAQNSAPRHKNSRTCSSRAMSAPRAGDCIALAREARPNTTRKTVLWKSRRKRESTLNRTKAQQTETSDPIGPLYPTPNALTSKEPTGLYRQDSTTARSGGRERETETH